MSRSGALYITALAAVPIAAGTDVVEALISAGILAEGETWPLDLGTGIFKAGSGSVFTGNTGTAVVEIDATGGSPNTLVLKRTDTGKMINFFVTGAGVLTVGDGVAASCLGVGPGSTVGFYATTPVAQHAAITKPAATGSALASFGYTQAQADAIVTAVNAIIDTLGAAAGVGLTA